LTEQAADAAIDTACRLLRLPSIRNEFNEIADRAVKDQMTYRGFLAELLMTECDDRARRRSERRIKAAGFPREKSLRAFDFDANPNIDAATVHTLASCEWIKKSQPLCLIGDSGTGKSHMLIALGTEAAMKGYRVRYTLATKLVNELVEAADEKQLNKTIARYGRVDLLCIDELGYMELDRHGAELLFQVLTEREEKNSVAIASNESFGGWTKTFTDPRLCAAIVDRLTFNGTIIETALTPTASPAPGHALRSPPRPAEPASAFHPSRWSCRPEQRAGPATSLLAVQQRIHEHVPPVGPHLLPAPQQPLTLEPRALGSAHGTCVPRLDIQLKPRNPQFAQGPVGDGADRGHGRPLPTRRLNDPVAQRCPALPQVLQPQPHIPDRPTISAHDDERIPSPRGRPTPLPLDERDSCRL
jgi:DNA replication protein DnaC